MYMYVTSIYIILPRAMYKWAERKTGIPLTGTHEQNICHWNISNMREYDFVKANPFNFPRNFFL